MRNGKIGLQTARLCVLAWEYLDELPKYHVDFNDPTWGAGIFCQYVPDCYLPVTYGDILGHSLTGLNEDHPVYVNALRNVAFQQVRCCNDAIFDAQWPWYLRMLDREDRRRNRAYIRKLTLKRARALRRLRYLNILLEAVRAYPLYHAMTRGEVPRPRRCW